MRNLTEKTNVKAVFQAAIAFSIIVTLCGALHAAESTATPTRTQADVKKIIAEQKAQLEKDSKAFEEAKTYPYYSFYQVPAARGRRDTELRKVLTGSLPGEKPEDYNLRVVQFANRKGVDYLDVDPRMPLREWTFTEEAYTKAGIPAKYRTDNRKVKAHLAGFFSIGCTIDEGEFAGRYEIPKLLLRFSDGRVRMVLPVHISSEDQDFVAGHHKAAMDEIKAARLKEHPRVIPAGHKQQYANPKQPGEKNGHMITESEFFYFVSGTEHPEPGNAGSWCTWINSMGDQKAGRWERLKRMTWFDSMWLVYEYGGYYMPQIGAQGQPREKFGWYVGGPTIDGKGTNGGGGGWHIGNGDPGIGAHEWGHMTGLPGVQGPGRGETMCDTLRDTAMGGGGGPQLKTPHNHVFSGGDFYGQTHFYRAVGEDPSLGYLWCARLPAYSSEGKSSFLVFFEMFKRLQLTDYADPKMVNKPVVEFGDLFGEYAARSATFDFQREVDRMIPGKQILEKIDTENNIWRVPPDFAPQTYGFNVVRLIPGKGAGSFEVDFTGMHDPKTFSDWRVSLVAVGGDGVRRYSKMWNKGAMTFDVKPDDKSLWLVVAATPTAYTSMATSGRRGVSYPWQVKLTGATVGTPEALREDYGPRTLPSAVALSELVRHKNGGGLVAKTATVAETAYVGPNAMVLGTATVKDNARIEGYAVVKDKATVEENAKLYGAAVTDGGTVVRKDSRFHLPVIKHEHIGDLDVIGTNTLPPRYGSARFNEQGIWAVYAMMDADDVYLYDYFRYKAEPSPMDNNPTWPTMDGFVFGKPRAVVYDTTTEEPVAGLQFDGEKQYALLHPAAVDLVEATIVARLIVEPNVGGTIFDCGTDKENCMTFAVAKDGTLTLKAVVDGKTQFDLEGGEKMIRSKAVSLRVEVDGKTVALWMGRDKIAETKSAFRCTDLFGPDVVRSNTIAAGRDGKGNLKSIFDSVTIYAKVHNSVDANGVVAFDKLPPIPLEAPPIVGDNILALLAKRDDPKQAAAIREAAKKVTDFYQLGGSPAKHTWNYDLCNKGFFQRNTLGKRLHQLIRRDPDYVKWVDEILPKLGEETQERRTVMEREFHAKIYQKSVNSSDEARAIGHLAHQLWNAHWRCDYARYLNGEHVPAHIKSVSGLGMDGARGRLNPDSWIKSSDVTVSKPDLWSVEGILSGEYDKLSPDLRQWYLHTHGPIKIKE
jgi:hypothetical protein